MDRDESQLPREQLPITLFDSVVLAVRAADDRLHLVSFRLRLGRQVRTLECLQLDDIPLWLVKVRPPRGNAHAAERLRYVQSYLIASVRSAFAALTGLPDAPSNQIEDLQELDIIDPALQGLRELAERQTRIEESQDRAREAWRDIVTQIRELHGVLPAIEALRTRMQEVERQIQIRMSPEQRNTIYLLVQAYGEARAARGEAKPGVEIRKCWAEFNARFGIATYTDLSADRFDEAVQFVKNQYRALTGSDIESGTQEWLL